MRILLAESDENKLSELNLIIEQGHYVVDTAPDGSIALLMIEKNIYDVIILNTGLEKISGFEITKEVRAKGIKTPIMLVSENDDVSYKVEGFDSGADDFLTRPFVKEELLARIRALCRRNINTPDGSLSFGDIILRPALNILECTTTGHGVRLSEKEYNILEYMIANQGQIVTREQLSLKIWGYDSEAEYNNVEVYMTFTRKKLAGVDAKTTIKAVRGIGYELRFESV